MYIRKIQHEFDGDTFFLKVNIEKWIETFVEKGIKNDKNLYNYYFHVYDRKSIKLIGAGCNKEMLLLKEIAKYVVKDIRLLKLEY